jgi:L-fuculose-phosphate aldolase
MQDEREIRELICELGRRMYAREWVAANDGNISYRMGDGTFLCTPTCTSKGFMKPEEIAVVDGEGNQLSGTLPRTSEILLHLEVFHELPEINAVCHAHPPYATAFAVAGVPVPEGILPEVEIWIGQVPYAPYETPGCKDFAETVLPHLRNDASTILLGNHGAVAFDSDLLSAYFHLETVDMCCRILLLAKQVGNVQLMSGEKVRELLDIKRSIGIKDPRMDFTAAQCTPDPNNAFLRTIPGRTDTPPTVD